MTEDGHTWGAANILLGLALLGYTWRLQDLFRVVQPLKPVTLITGALLVVILLDRRLPDQIVMAGRRSTALLGILLLLVALAGVPFSLYAGLSFEVATKDLLPDIALMILAAAAIETPLDAYRLAAVNVIGALIFAGYVLTHFSVGPGGRLGNLVHYDANDLGLLLVCTLPLAEWCMTYARRLSMRIAAAGVVVVLLITIVKTGSRGAFLGLVAVVGYAIVARRSASVARRFTIAAVVAALLLVVAAGTEYWNTMETILHPKQDYNWVGQSEEGRMDVWKRGIGYMTARPITGVGLGAFPTAEGKLSPLAKQQAYGIGLKWSAAHNSFLQVGAELGFPGLLIYLALLGSGFRKARDAVLLGLSQGDVRAAALADALAASIVGFVVSGFFLSEAYTAFTYTIIGIAIGIERVLAGDLRERDLARPQAGSPIGLGAGRD